jgi:hypothetical protein
MAPGLIPPIPLMRIIRPGTWRPPRRFPLPPGSRWALPGDTPGGMQLARWGCRHQYQPQQGGLGARSAQRASGGARTGGFGDAGRGRQADAFQGLGRGNDVRNASARGASSWGGARQASGGGSFQRASGGFQGGSGGLRSSGGGGVPWWWRGVPWWRQRSVRLVVWCI